MNKDVAHTHNGILLSHKEERVNAICSNMDRPRVSEVSQKEKDKYHMISLICGYKWYGLTDIEKRLVAVGSRCLRDELGVWG